MSETTPPEFTIEDARNVARSLMNQTAMMATIPDGMFEAILRESQRASALGPVLEPSAWNKIGAFETHEAVENIIRALAELRRAHLAYKAVLEKYQR